MGVGIYAGHREFEHSVLIFSVHLRFCLSLMFGVDVDLKVECVL